MHIFVWPSKYYHFMLSKFHLTFVMASSSFLLCFLTFILLIGLFKLTESSKLEIEELSWLDDDKDEEINIIQSCHDSLRKCDFGSGKWVYDQTYHLYDASICPYLSTSVTCRKNRRSDSGYEKWRWKPRGCNIPRFDAFRFDALTFQASMPWTTCS